MAPHRSLADEWAQPHAPVVVAGDPGLAARPFPCRRGIQRSRRVTWRHVGQQCEQALPAQATPVDVEQIEHEAGNQPLAEQRAGPSVPDDARGVEVVLDQPGIRLLRRPDDPDPLERDTAAGRLQHGPHRVADLVVGVGGRNDRDVALRGEARPSVEHGRIVFDEVDIDPLGEGLDELEREATEVDGQMHDDVTPVDGAAGLDETRRFGEQVGLVVPRALEAGRDRPADPDHFLCPLRGRGEPNGGAGTHEAELVVNPPERHHGGGVTGDVAKRTRVRVEHLRDGQFDQRRRHR